MDLEVEPVAEVDEAAVPAGVDAAEYVLYGGKGGVGKTTLAAATALASARDGTATLVVSTDPAHSLADTLETDVPAEPARIRDDIPLFAAEIDAETAMERSPFDAGDGGGAIGSLLGDDAANPLEAGMPGSDEAAAVWLLLEYLDDDRFERVVVDTAPTGHTLRLLELPDILDSMVGTMLKLRERLGSLFEGFGEVMGGDTNDAGELGDLEAVSARVERLRALLRDPDRTDFRVVLVPEELAVEESERLLSRLQAFDIPVGTVVVNRVLQAPAEVADVDPERFVAPNHEDCAFCARRWEVQRRALTAAQDCFRGHDVRRVPLFAEEVRGDTLLRATAACLED